MESLNQSQDSERKIDGKTDFVLREEIHDKKPEKFRIQRPRSNLHYLAKSGYSHSKHLKMKRSRV